MMKTLRLILTMAILSQCRDITEEIGDCSALSLDQVSYSVYVYPIVSKTCAIPQCHSVDFEYGNFNNFEEFKKKADNGKLKFMIESHQMPHGFTDGPLYLTTCEIETIKKWIDEGANNN
jgi:hypothetical protein